MAALVRKIRCLLATSPSNLRLFSQATDSGRADGRRGLGAKRWTFSDDPDAFHIRGDQPGRDESQVQVLRSPAKDQLLILGEETATDTKCYMVAPLAAECEFKVEEMKVEMENGVLRVVIPKGKPFCADAVFNMFDPRN